MKELITFAVLLFALTIVVYWDEYFYSSRDLVKYLDKHKYEYTVTESNKKYNDDCYSTLLKLKRELFYHEDKINEISFQKCKRFGMYQNHAFLMYDGSAKVYMDLGRVEKEITEQPKQVSENIRKAIEKDTNELMKGETK